MNNLFPSNFIVIEILPTQTRIKKKKHLLFQENCREVILPNDKPFRRLEHYKMHEYSRKLSLTKDPLTMTHLATSIDGMFCRKRGRPPKNRVIEVWNDYVRYSNRFSLRGEKHCFKNVLVAYGWAKSHGFSSSNLHQF